MSLPPNALNELHALRAQGLALRAAGADAAALADLERRIVDLVLAPEPARANNRLLAACVGAALLLAAAGYAWKGNPGAINPAPPPDRTEEMVQRLATRLQQQPDDAKGWAMLGRSYAVLGRPALAQQAYEKALALQPQNPDVLADFADVLATAQNGSLEGEPAALLARALKAEPNHTKALALEGTRALRAGDRERARALWQQLLKTAPADHPLRGIAEKGLGELG
ncbi:cytochrome c-type biogenesis protein CcmH [Inhella inkyongensis]|uniref:Cytochrome c-type biogenesis protein CcmH n=1 Tax=Inhella inkyongensis TaxID=392593 RepID=A0A840S8B1_9BURK|nr:tetratricopeptide repeat protein [Inhella inkyongensis]MBB5205034.1 cytochrome c-type biogenesis protein CcmH [Inhella inkyongensis]